MKMLIAILLLASTLALASTLEEDFERIDQYQMQEEAWRIELHKRYQEDADTKEEWERWGESIEDSQDRLRDLIRNQR